MIALTGAGLEFAAPAGATPSAPAENPGAFDVLLSDSAPSAPQRDPDDVVPEGSTSIEASAEDGEETPIDMTLEDIDLLMSEIAGRADQLPARAPRDGMVAPAHPADQQGSPQADSQLVDVPEAEQVSSIWEPRPARQASSPTQAVEAGPNAADMALAGSAEASDGDVVDEMVPEQSSAGRQPAADEAAAREAGSASASAVSSAAPAPAVQESRKPAAVPSLSDERTRAAEMPDDLPARPVRAEASVPAVPQSRTQPVARAVPDFEAAVRLASREAAPESGAAASEVAEAPSEKEAPREAEARSRPAPAAGFRSPLAANVASQLQGHDLRDGAVTIRLKPHGMGLIEVEIARNARGDNEVLLRVQNPMVLEALRGERQAMADILSGQGGLSMELFLPDQEKQRQEQKKASGASTGLAPEQGEPEPDQEPRYAGAGILI